MERFFTEKKLDEQTLDRYMEKIQIHVERSSIVAQRQRWVIIFVIAHMWRIFNEKYTVLDPLATTHIDARSKESKSRCLCTTK